MPDVRMEGDPLTDEPAVLTWMLALAPRPAMRVSSPGHHWWRELVTEAWRTATLAWEADRERVALGYSTEMIEYEAAHPRPRLGDFMRHLSTGAWSPEAVL